MNSFGSQTREYTQVRIEVEVHKRLQLIAQREHRSMASQIAHLVDQEWIKQNGQPEPQFIHNLDVADCPPAE